MPCVGDLEANWRRPDSSGSVTVSINASGAIGGRRERGARSSEEQGTRGHEGDEGYRHEVLEERRNAASGHVLRRGLAHAWDGQ